MLCMKNAQPPGRLKKTGVPPAFKVLVLISLMAILSISPTEAESTEQWAVKIYAPTHIEAEENLTVEASMPSGTRNATLHYTVCYPTYCSLPQSTPMEETENSTPQSPFFSATVGPFENGVDVEFHITYYLNNTLIDAGGWKVSVGSRENGKESPAGNTWTAIPLTFFLLATPPTVFVTWYGYARRRRKDAEDIGGGKKSEEKI